MTPSNGASSRLWRVLVAIVLLAVVAIGVVALFPPARHPAGQPSTMDEDDDWVLEDPAPSPSLVTEEDDGSQDGFGRPPSDTGESLPNLDDGSTPVTDTPGAVERVEDDERQ